MTIIPSFLFDRNFGGDKNSVRLFGAESLRFGLPNFEEYLLYDGEDILKRQSVFRDIYTYPALLNGFEKLFEMCENVKSVFTKNGELGSTEGVVYSLLELHNFCTAVDYAAHKLFSPIPEGAALSQALFDLCGRFAALAATKDYISVREWLNSLDISLKNIRSVTLGVNLNAQLDIAEVGVVSFNEHPFVSGGFLEAMLRDKSVPREYTCIATLGTKESGKLLGKGSIAVNREFFGAMNTLFRGSVRALKRYVTDSFKEEVMALISLSDDIEFLVKSARYMQYLRSVGLKLTFPGVSEKTEIRGLANPNLTDKCKASQIVVSDAEFDMSRRIYILTGPNSGGKSVYLAAVGIAQIMFQLGLPICAEFAQIKPCGEIIVLFVKEIVKSTESRLENEVLRLRAALDVVTDSSLVLLDEMFSSTSAYDGVLLAKSLVKHLEKRQCFVLYATHFHELAEWVRGFSKEPIQLLSAESRDGHRTYRIVPGDECAVDSSLARDIVIENGLGFLFE